MPVLALKSNYIWTAGLTNDWFQADSWQEKCASGSLKMKYGMEERAT